MSDVDNMFSQLKSNPLIQEAQDARRQGSFEERIVKQLLRYAGVQLQVGKMKREADHNYGNNALNFSWLRSELPEFPVFLASSKLPHTSGSKIGWTDLFGSGFAKLPWVREYQKVAETYDWNIHADRCALVFNAPGADSSALMVIHNQPIQSAAADDPEQRRHAETRVLRPYGKPQVVYVIESLRSFMTTVGTEWAAELWQHH